jgi:hypothetical protein
MQIQFSSISGEIEENMETNQTWNVRIVCRVHGPCEEVVEQEQLVLEDGGAVRSVCRSIRAVSDNGPLLLRW